MYITKRRFFISYFILIFLAVSLMSCSSKFYEVKKEDNKVPSWYMEEKSSSSRIYAKASASSPSLELAVLKALNLALSDVAIRMQGSVDSERKQQLNESMDNNKLAKSYVQKDQINNKINVQVNDFKIPAYTIVKKEAFLDQNRNYKVYIMLEFKKDQS